MIVVDVETTGTDPHKNGILSIGAVEFEQPDNQFYKECRIGAKTAVDTRALKINGFSTKDITDPNKPTEPELLGEFAQWLEPIKDKTLGGHNTAFDVRMLRAALKRTTLDTFIPFSAIDMHNLAYSQMKSSGQPIPINKYGFYSAKADHIFEYVGLTQEPLPHHGLTGAKMEAEAMSRLIYGKNLLPDYKEHPIPDYLQR